MAWLAAAGRVAAEPPDPTFAAASAAFEQGDYRGALGLFMALRRAGARSPAVSYNIGVCHYRLGEYARAEAEFRLLGRDFPMMRELAEYNRGLSWLALSRERDARIAFERARRSADPGLAELAAAALGRLGSARAATRASRWAGLFDLGLGHDDNVVLVDELALPAGQSADSAFTELLALAGRAFGVRNEFRVDVSGYLVRYPDAEQYDQDSWRVGGAFQRRGAGWRAEIGPYYDYSRLDGEGFERRLGVGARLDRVLGGQWRAHVRLVVDDIDALEPRYGFVGGSRRQLRLGVEHGDEASRFRVGYDLEANDRDAASVSSDRDRLTLGYRRRVGAGWAVDGAVARRVSRYDDLDPAREETLTEVSVDGRRELDDGWSLVVAYRRSDNDSNVDAFAYTGDRISVRMAKAF
jgi:tetratricopeptide (TPR) repeat protein